MAVTVDEFQFFLEKEWSDGFPAVSRLHAETTKILNSAALKEQFGTQGLEPIPTSPETFAKLLRADIEKWGRVIKASGAKPE